MPQWARGQKASPERKDVVNDKRVTANRAKAARSTGPRIKAGKAATRLNALRDGLAAASRYEPGADQESEALAPLWEVLALCKVLAFLQARHYRFAQATTALALSPPSQFAPTLPSS